MFITHRLIVYIISNYSSIYLAHINMMARGIYRGQPHFRQFSRSITIRTDGACIGNGRFGAKAGIGIYFENGELDDISAPLYYGRKTNQRAEIIAAMTGINAAKEAGFDDITVKLDSIYVKRAMDVWIHNWIRNEWRGKITNKDDFLNLYDSMEGVKVYFQWIPREDNEKADQLAKEGAKRDYDC